jgi:periplasmic copper chaperone A
MNYLRAFIGVLAAVAVAGIAEAHEVANKGVMVAHPWLRATPGGATIGAAFMEIRTDKGVTDRLISASSPVAGRVEVHTHTMEGDVMKMRKVDGIDLKPGESHVLKPMGEHMMLFDLKQPLKEGDLVRLQLTFEKAGVLEIDGSVEPVGANGPHGMDHQPVSGDDMGGMDHKQMDHEHMDHEQPKTDQK